MKPFIYEKAENQKPSNIGDIILHGDVIVYHTENLPENFATMQTEPNACLAYGEATGHAHQLQDGEFELKIDPENPTVRHLRVIKPTALRHQEHKEITLRPGNYRIGIQREYDPFEKKIRDVVD